MLYFSTLTRIISKNKISFSVASQIIDTSARENWNHNITKATRQHNILLLLFLSPKQQSENRNFQLCEFWARDRNRPRTTEKKTAYKWTFHAWSLSGPSYFLFFCGFVRKLCGTKRVWRTTVSGSAFRGKIINKTRLYLKEKSVMNRLAALAVRQIAFVTGPLQIYTVLKNPMLL